MICHGIGLHSYGFTDAAFYWLSAFIVSQLVIMPLACLARHKAGYLNPCKPELACNGAPIGLL